MQHQYTQKKLSLGFVHHSIITKHFPIFFLTVKQSFCDGLEGEVHWMAAVFGASRMHALHSSTAE